MSLKALDLALKLWKRTRIETKTIKLWFRNSEKNSVKLIIKYYKYFKMFISFSREVDDHKKKIGSFDGLLKFFTDSCLEHFDISPYYRNIEHLGLTWGRIFLSWWSISNEEFCYLYSTYLGTLVLFTHIYIFKLVLSILADMNKYK